MGIKMKMEIIQDGNTNEGFEMEETYKRNADEEIDFENSKIAIRVQNAEKSYGSNKVISSFNMTVPEGAIYALLGSSNCGKTTILNCILGLKKLNGGSIDIFGCPTGTVESGVPGSRIGYQPQDLSLFEDFSIKEIMYYFGRIYGLSNDKIQEKIDFLVKFLKLPNDIDSLIRTLSGGQQRRVSFAIALIHDAQILILDEPTVGVDPILRTWLRQSIVDNIQILNQLFYSIWEYLRELANSKKTTIIITTHYIEEAEGASIVGIMRNGRILVEESPQKLMSTYGTSLSDIVLEISQKDEDDELGDIHLYNMEIQSRNQNRKSFDVKVPWTNKKSDKISRIKALVLKNYIRIWRNFGYLILMTLVVGGMILFSCITIGKNLTDINFGIVNQEVPDHCKSSQNNPNLCGHVNTSCLFPNYLPKNKFNLKYYANEEDALYAVQHGKVWGYTIMPEKFSDSFPKSGDDIKVKLDMTNQLVTQDVQFHIKDSIKRFKAEWHSNCTKDNFTEVDNRPNLKGFYGNIDIPFVEYFGTSFFILNMFFAGMTLTGVEIILEKKSGLYERSLAAGVTKNEIVLSHFISQFGLFMILASFSLFNLYVILQITLKGSFLNIILLTIVQGTNGILLGFVISTICTNDSSVVQICLFITMGAGFLSGAIWPLEGMNHILKYIALAFPITLTSKSMRSISTKGNGLFHQNVWPGFAASFAWSFGFILIILILNRFFNKS